MPNAAPRLFYGYIMSELDIVIGEDGDIRHLNKDELNGMELGKVTQIERSSNVEVFDDLPLVAQAAVAKLYGSRGPGHHIQRFPQHRLQWWVWVITLKMISGPYASRTQALNHEVILLQDRGLPLREHTSSEAASERADQPVDA